MQDTVRRGLVKGTETIPHRPLRLRTPMRGWHQPYRGTNKEKHLTSFPSTSIEDSCWGNTTQAKQGRQLDGKVILGNHIPPLSGQRIQKCGCQHSGVVIQGLPHNSWRTDWIAIPDQYDRRCLLSKPTDIEDPDKEKYGQHTSYEHQEVLWPQKLERSDVKNKLARFRHGLHLVDDIVYIGEESQPIGEWLPI